jgi:hypothetical protein
VLIDRSELHKGRPEKSLTEGLTKSGGRGGNGRIAVRFRGGGAKRLYRKIDFKRRKFKARRSSVWNTTRTAPPSSPSSSMRTAKRPTSSRRNASRRATKSSPAKRST